MNEIQQLINSYIEQNKYISCLEELYILFEKNNISSEDRTSYMKEIYKYNKKIYAIEQKKSQKLDNMEKNKIVTTTAKEISIPVSINTNKKIEPLQCDITPFIEEIKKFNDISDLDYILPDRNSEQFDNVIDMILVELYREKVEILNLICEHQEREPMIYQFFEWILSKKMMDCIVNLRRKR